MLTTIIIICYENLYVNFKVSFNFSQFSEKSDIIQQYLIN